MIFNGTLEKGEDIEMQLFVRNEGNMSNGKLYIWENDETTIPNDSAKNKKSGTSNTTTK